MNLVQIVLFAADPGGREVAIAGVEGSNIAEMFVRGAFCVVYR
jgi:hypothetical protein